MCVDSTGVYFGGRHFATPLDRIDYQRKERKSQDIAYSVEGKLVTLLILLCTGVILYFMAQIMKLFSTKQVLWSSFWLIPALGLPVLISSILIAFEAISTNDDLKGFAGNIAAEGIGIFLTVFIIDRLIKQREERRLLAAKQIVYARFLLIIDHLLEDMSKLFPGDYCKSSENLYLYGITPVYSKIRFDDLSTLHASISTVQENIGQHINIQESSDHSNMTRYNIYKNTPLSSASDQVNQIFSGSILLIEPELNKLLNQFFLDCENLKYATDVAEKFPIPYEERWDRISNTVFVGYTEKSMTTAIEIREWLIAKADSHL
jgi:hypothetical protein